MITIIITGPTKSGKTTLASEIQALFESLKIGVTNKDPDLPRPEEVHAAALEALSGANVVVYTQTSSETEPQMPSGIFTPGSPVRMTNKFKWQLHESNCQDHLERFGGCIGIVTAFLEGTDQRRVWVEWLGSTSRHHYGIADLEPA